MSEARLPFRSRVLSPVNRALATIESQAGAARWRLNQKAVARAFFVVAGAMLLGVSLLIGLAFLLSSRPYAFATWASFAALALLLLSRARRLRRAWLRGADAPIFIDHRVGLDDRLATLTGAPSTARQSRLWEFLLHENLRLLPRWEPRQLEPRALPGSLWFFVAALLLSSLSLWVTPRRSGVMVASRPSVGEERPPPAASDEDPASEAEDSDVGPKSSLWNDLPERLRQAILGSQSSRNFAGEIPEKTLPVDEDRGGPAIVGNRMKSHGPVRSAPASPDAARAAGQQGSAANAPTAGSGARREAGEPDAASRPARGERAKELERVESGRPKSGTHSAPTQGGSGAGGGGAGSGGDNGGLFGERQASGAAAGSFTLDLDAARAAKRSKEGENEASPSAPPPSHLADDQRLDDAVRRAQVPVEYEAIVQRIFSRAVDTSERRGEQE